MPKLKMCRPIALTIIAVVVFALTAAAQRSAEQIKAELASLWVVTVEGEARTRTLEIQTVTTQSETDFLLSSTYGWSDGARQPVTATASTTPKGLKLQFTTPAGSLIVAEQSGDGSFSGTFKDKKGSIKKVTLEKKSPFDNTIQTGPSAAETAVITMADMKSFVGKWAGEWELNDAGRNTRSVELTVEMNAGGKPVVTYHYGTAQLGTSHLASMTAVEGTRKVKPRFIRKEGEVYLTFPTGYRTGTYEFHLVNGNLEGKDERAGWSITCVLKRMQ